MADEAKFQQKMVKWLRSKGAKVIKMDPSMGAQKGIPDYIVLKSGWWGLIEFKAHKNSPKRPGQQQWIDWAEENSWGRFCYPENEKEVKAELGEILRGE